jgi:hypothetical protein
MDGAENKKPASAGGSFGANQHHGRITSITAVKKQWIASSNRDTRLDFATRREITVDVKAEERSSNPLISLVKIPAAWHSRENRNLP